ncbi:MAG: tRNA (adenosine(37)-N6)-threonylcarbamoyltransferase complex transferase subunit TsaD [Coriobacteriia bacterium]|nr:tRNA (adenosine(37)-N6)-threonylcarbamoyltransferase complex transferase subunit TsaD [Coriobacteriia bacterium]
MAVAIREMRADDLEQVLAIERASFPTPWSPGIFSQELAFGGRLWRVLERDGEVVGYGGVMAVGEDGHLMNLALRSDVRGRGLGLALLSHLIEASVALGVRRLTLEVRPSNAAAAALYERAGFSVAGRRPGYYEDTSEDAVIMWTGDLLSPHYRELRAELADRAHAAIGAEAAPAPAYRGAGGETILAIETSCDETAAAVMRGGRELLADVVASQVEFHRRFGGVVPEIASRKHTEAVVPVVEEALDRAGVGLEGVDAIAVTHGPGLVGALAVGLAYAKGLAFALGVPLVGVNHLEGHVFANVLADPTVGPPLVALVVSGGHTSLVHMPEWGVYRTLGETLDDATGEAFDKVAKVLGLGYPGGPVLSRLAEDGSPDAIAFPRPMMRSGDYDFSLSGLKTAVINHVRAEREAGRSIDLPDLAASFQQAIVDVQVAKSVRAVEETGVTTFCLAGGVAANPRLREGLRAALAERGVRVCVPPPTLCTDNAAMIAAAAHWRLARGDVLGPDAEAVPNLRLDSGA